MLDADPRKELPKLPSRGPHAVGHSALPGTRLPPSKHLRPFTPSALTPSPSPSPPTLLVACAELCTLIRRI